MKNKGFTLIELLAVIVILAIIALIAVPSILSAIETAKKGSFQNSVYHVIEAVELDLVANERKLPFSYVVSDNDISPNVSIKGKINAYGKISVDEKGQIEVLLDNGTWCAKKYANDSKVHMESSPCVENPIILGSINIEPKWGEGLLISTPAISQTTTITSYEMIIKKDNEIIDSYISTENQLLYSFEKMTNNGHYQIDVEVKDDQGNKQNTNIEYDLTYEPIKSRYLVVEVYDKLGGDGAAINELEFIDANNQKLSYTVIDAYDSVTNTIPYYWNKDVWQKENLYDGEYSYTSNKNGRSTSTLFLFDDSSTSHEGAWARFLVDFGTEIEIKKVNLWTGGTEERQPNTIKMYSYNSEIDTTFSSTYIQNRDTSLPLIYEKKFTTIYTTPTEDTNYLVYPKDTDAPIIKAINAKVEINTLTITADVEEPNHTFGINNIKYALIKDNNKLSTNDITTWEIAKNSTITYDLTSLDNGTYYIYVEVTDNGGNKAFKVSEAYELQKTKLNYQYMIMEVYDHFASNGSVVTELEFYNNSNQKLTYEITNIYDSAQQGIPYYWNKDVWQKDNLYDGVYTYSSNKTGGSTSTLFNYGSTANQGSWSRAIIDFSEETNIDNLKIWLGGPEGRLPKEVHFYVTDSKEVDSIYNQNIKVRDNTDLTEVARLSFAENISTVTMFEKNNLNVYTFQKKS